MSAILDELIVKVKAQVKESAPAGKSA